MLTHYFFFIKITPYEDIIFLVLCTYNPFWCCWIPMKILGNRFCAWWRIFNAFVPTCAVSFRTTHGQNHTRKYDAEGFVSVSSLNGVIVSPSSFISYLIGRTRKIWYVLYINGKRIYASKTLACTIIECAIIRNVLHVTSTYRFISWCSGSANVKWTPRVWHSSLNYVEVNCFPASTEILSILTIQIRLFSQIWIETYPVCP